MTFQPQPTKRYASSAESIETSSSTYHLTKAKRSKVPLYFGYNFRRQSTISSLWKASPSFSIKSTTFVDVRKPALQSYILSNALTSIYQNLNQEVHLSHLPHLLSQYIYLSWHYMTREYHQSLTKPTTTTFWKGAWIQRTTGYNAFEWSRQHRCINLVLSEWIYWQSSTIGELTNFQWHIVGTWYRATRK